MNAITFLHGQNPSDFTRRVSEVRVRQSCPNPCKTVLQERHEIAERVIAFVRERYPTKTVDHVAHDLGCTPFAVQKWLSRESAPSLPTFGKMGLIYGPAFVAYVFPKWKWASAASRAEMSARLKASIEAQQRELDELTKL